MAKCLRWPVPLRSGWLMLWVLYQFNNFPLTISRLLSSLYTNTLPNQITFGFWALISGYLICIVMLTPVAQAHTQSHYCWHVPARWLLPQRMPTGLSGWTHDWGHLVKLVFHCTRQDEHNWFVGSQLGTVPKTAQYSESHTGLAFSLNNHLETMVLREDYHKPHQLLLELQCPCLH